MKLFKAESGMTIVGQGSKIMRFAFPSAIAAVALQFFAPAVARLPVSSAILTPLGYIFLAAAFALWLPAVIQLLIGFPKGRLVKTGAFAVCRNPMYSSFALFLMPGVSLVTATWGYLIVTVFMLWGISKYIRPEEEKLRQVFGAEYDGYLKSVSRVLPFIKPAR
jgi:protein-S-isoprenylcysteine O-methyltransferase Ste14